MKKTGASGLEKLKVIKINLRSKNVRKYFKSDDLLKEYDFTKYCIVNDSKNILISGSEISSIFDRKFKEVENRTAETILELAEKCEIDDALETNFKIYADGAIKLGWIMREIKEQLNDIKVDYQKYLEREYNVIKFEFEE